MKDLKTSNRKIANTIIDILNDAMATDEDAMGRLMASQASCNQTMADHPTIVVKDNGQETFLTPRGLINGIVEPLCGERIGAQMTPEGTLLGFQIYE